jgi:hypothetical protein
VPHAQPASAHPRDRVPEASLRAVLPCAEEQRRRQALAPNQPALAAQETPREAPVTRHERRAGLVRSIAAGCPRGQRGFAEATWAPQRPRVARLIARGRVDNAEGAMRYVLPMTPPGATTRVSPFRQDSCQMPLGHRPGVPTTSLVSIGLSELPAPVAHGFVRQQDATFRHRLFDIPVAEAKAEGEPDAVTDDLR